MDYLAKRISVYYNRYLSSKIIFSIDILTSVIASLLSLLLIFAITSCDFDNSSSVLLYLTVTLVSSGLIFYIFTIHKIIIRHSTLKDSVWLLVASLLKTVCSGAVFILFVGFSHHVVFLGITDFLITFFGLMLSRISMIVVYDMAKAFAQKSYNRTDALIYGTSDKSVAVLTSLKSSTRYNVRGFVKHDSNTSEQFIGLNRIYTFFKEGDFEKLIDKTRINAIIFPSAQDARTEQNRLIKYALAHKVQTLISPSIDEITDDRINAYIRNINIEDLLDRDEIRLPMDRIISTFRNKVILVTGAAGSIGSELVRQLATFGVKKLVLYDNAETPLHNIRLELEDKYPALDFVPIVGDIRIPSRLDFAFREHHPQIVFHAAAYKHVPLMEENPCEAVHANVAGSRYVADKCIEYDVEKMVMISTDKAVNPTNIMGCTKRLAEIYVQSLGLAVENGTVPGRTKFVTTRFGNVLGSNGSVILRFKDQIAAGGPVTVTHPEVLRYFMTIPEACQLVMEAVSITSGNQIFAFDMGQPVKIDHIARRMIQLSGYEPDKDIMIEYTGLRPGEKLYEELLANGENTIPTEHNRIHIAKVREYDYLNVIKTVNALERLSLEVNIPEMVKLMKATVPEFKSKNSPYEIYDIPETANHD